MERKKLTTEKFIERAKKIHNNKYDYSLVNYINNTSKVNIICPIHKIFQQIPANHLQGKGCQKCSAKENAKNKKLGIINFIKKANYLHNNFYNYSKVNYTNYHDKINIVCPIHGDFWQIVGNHLNGRGCRKCGSQKLRKERVKSNEQFIKESILLHKNKYDYSLVEYKKANIKVCIICPTHGEFWQTPNTHLAGRGCLKCRYKNSSKIHSDNPTGWSLRNWIKAAEKSSNFKGFRSYIIECWNEKERFFKIGRTFKSTNNRFKNKNEMPYNYEVLYEFENTAEVIYEFEIFLKKLFKDYKYLPKIKFNGMKECFKLYHNESLEELQQVISQKTLKPLSVEEEVTNLSIPEVVNIKELLSKRVVNI